ncbi:MAG: 2Fe-2S iron-sulfur cluster binding domain-containing protein [Verrucomicrobiales bacterium]|nr:2Fe-2S iron-sulfur cluster binding domain-containing protein [Verrucomicrobiales bacterium]
MMTLNVNGTTYQANISDGATPLLWVLRDILGLTGTKYGCGIQSCGACMVLIDGQPEYSCVFDVSSAVGKRVVTIEGLSQKNDHPAQKLWQNLQVPQCGYCQSGMIMATAGAMLAGHRGSEILPEVKNLCVCGTYNRLRRAIRSL